MSEKIKSEELRGLIHQIQLEEKGMDLDAKRYQWISQSKGLTRINFVARLIFCASDTFDKYIDQKRLKESVNGKV